MAARRAAGAATRPDRLADELRLTPAARRVLAVLRAAGARGAVTGQLVQAEVGGSRAGARVHDLRAAGFVVEQEMVRQGSYRYTLTYEPGQVSVTVLRAVPAGGWGHVCEMCGHRWDTTARADAACPECGASTPWVATADVDLATYWPLLPSDAELEAAELSASRLYGTRPRAISELTSRSPHSQLEREAA